MRYNNFEVLEEEGNDRGSDFGLMKIKAADVAEDEKPNAKILVNQKNHRHQKPTVSPMVKSISSAIQTLLLGVNLAANGKMLSLLSEL